MSPHHRPCGFPSTAARSLPPPGTKRGFVQGEPDEINDPFFNVRLRRILHRFSEALPKENPQTGFPRISLRAVSISAFSGFHMPPWERTNVRCSDASAKKLSFSVVLTIYQAATGFFMSHFFVLLYGKAFTNYIISPFAAAVQVLIA